MFNRKFLKDAAERTVSTFIQVFITTFIGAVVASGTGLVSDQTALYGVALTSAGAAVLAAMKALGKQIAAKVTKD